MSHKSITSFCLIFNRLCPIFSGNVHLAFDCCYMLPSPICGYLKSPTLKINKTSCGKSTTYSFLFFCFTTTKSPRPRNWRNYKLGTGLDELTKYGRRCRKEKRKKMKLLSSVWLIAIPWTVAYQASPSMGVSRKEYWSGLLFPSPGDLSDSGMELGCPALQADALASEPPGRKCRGRNWLMWAVWFSNSHKYTPQTIKMT